MSGKFEFVSDYKADLAYRAWNGAVASAVFYQLVNDPSASAAEYIPDIILHSVECLFPERLNNKWMIGWNALRGIQAAGAFVSGYAPSIHISTSTWPVGVMSGMLPAISLVNNPTTIPRAANGLDIANHGLNLLKRLGDYLTPTQKPHPQPALKHNGRELLLRKTKINESTQETVALKRSPRLNPRGYKPTI